MAGPGRFQELRFGFLKVWRAPGQQAIEDRTQAEQIGARVDTVGLPAGLLGGHVRQGPRNLLGREIADGLGQTKIHQPGEAIVANENIPGLQVAMEQTAGMDRGQTFGCLGD